MKPTSVRRLLLVAVLAGLTIAVAIVLYRRSKPIDMARHAQVMESIRRLQGLDSDLQEQVLSVRFNLLREYDGLTATSKALDALTAEIEAGSLAVLGANLVEERSSELRAALASRGDAVERFKTEASILRNSLYYLPVAAQHLETGLREANADPRGVVASHASSLVAKTLVYNLLGGRSTLDELEAQIGEMASFGADLPDGLRSDFDLFLRHAALISTQLGKVGELLGQIRSPEVLQALRRVEQTYGSAVAARMSTADDYRLALYGWSVLLLVLVAVVGWQLRQLYTHLEALVAERTRALKTALDQLWGEMRLARKIQTALLPPEPKLEGFEVAATMLPADEVGGDYYDIFHIGGHDWVLIGDVSGHGVPSGLVMMMCQTAARTAATIEPELMPDTLLSAVNEPLTDNIERLGDGRYMTCMAFRSEGDGRLLYAGMHQDLLVYRAGRRDVERIETEGMWLGLRKAIAPLQTSREMTLAPGDALLLYTDGLTEARRNGNLLDLDALQATLSRHGHLGAEQILFEILESLEDATVDDDVAVVVLKRKSEMTEP